MAEYYYGVGSERKGPFTLEDLKKQPIESDTLVWREGMAQWVAANQVPELADLFPGASAPVMPPPPPSSPPPPPPMAGDPTGTTPYPPGVTQSDVTSKRILCGVLGIVLGQLGIHKFILGYTLSGVIMLLLTVLTCGFGAAVTWVIGLIEGIIYLTKTDADFYKTYMANKKEWF